jgi:uncharacterized protein (UPF0264 family)
MTALLASVRTLEEARQAVRAGADIVDLKEPREGALGALPLALVESIVAEVRAIATVPVSATIGDLPDDAVDERVGRVLATARTGVDYVKVGMPRGPAGEVLARLRALPVPVVPLFFADDGLDFPSIEAAAALGFPIVMVDTADKTAGSLFDCVDMAELRRLLGIVRRAGARAGLAGSLRAGHVPALRELAPDIAGFRGALCEGSRVGRLDPARVRALRAVLAGPVPAPATTGDAPRPGGRPPINAAAPTRPEHEPG